MLQRRLLIISASAAAFAESAALAAGLTEGDAPSGIRTALERGAGIAIDGLGRSDGFLGNPAVRIELPGQLQSAAKLLKAAGQGRKVDELVTAMNHAAEQAVPAARPLLVNAIKSMSVDDGLRLLKGGDNAATKFFESKTRAPLAAQFLPIVTQATNKLAVADKYNAVAGKAAGFGLVKKEDANVQQYVTNKALDGLFLMMAEEEKKIRKDPIGTGSAILKKVFGGL